MTAYTARPFTTSYLQFGVNQVAHGFSRGEVIKFDGVNYIDAQADSEANSQAVGMVSYIIDADNFILTQVGYVSALTTGPYVAGTLYYLSPTSAGDLTATKPSTFGQVILPCFFADTTTSGFFFGGFGYEVVSGDVFSWTTIIANQTLAVNQGYFVNGAGALNNLLLPASAAVGDTIEIWDIAGMGFTITQNAGQSIIAGTTTSTPGVGGSVASAAQGNKLVLTCNVADTGFMCDISMSAGASITIT